MLENQTRKAERRMKRTIKKSATADSINLMEAFAEFIEEKEAQNKSAATIHNYKQSFEKYCAFNEFDDNTGIEEADQKAFLHWVNTMAQDLPPTTVNHYLRDVRTFLNWCMDEDRAYIEKRFKMKELSVQDTKPKAFSDDDIALLMEKPNRKADFVEWRTYVIVCWIMDNGARAQTICCVKRKDIDLKKKTITYAHTKNKKAQVVGMSDTLKTILKDYIRKWRYGADDEDYLFPNIGDEQLTTNALRCAFKRYCKDRGVEQHNIHGLRHTFSLDYVRNGGNQFKLQKILGHSTMEMTRRYVNLAAADITSDYDRFSPLATTKKKASRTKNIKESD